MSDESQSGRFKAEMPQIPGIGPDASSRRQGINPAVLLVGGILGVLVICFVGARLLVHPQRAEAPPPTPAQIEVPAPAADPTAAFPHATEGTPQIATLTEMAKPWSSKDFFFVNRSTGENVPALLIRLPGGSGSQPENYWALSLVAPFGNCKVEYLTDIQKLKSDYEFLAAKHPMVGNPCSRTVFDPLKMMTVTGDIWVRGGIVQGSDLRPPLGIQVKIQGKDILAVRME